jgi:phosphoribosylformimino-5-aminoimidazole carboxamide ribotide isomerase
MRIIPAIDIIDGKCVRLTQGDYGLKKIYNENPLEVALSFEAAGLKFLHLVDLDGAKAGKVTNWKVIDELVSKTNLKIDFGGGIKTEQEVKDLFDSGICQVNLGSIAVKNQKMVEGWLSKFGSHKIILSADVKNEMIAISGWTENAPSNIEDFLLDYVKKGIQYVTCTDISTDGMLAGPNIVLYKKLVTLFPSLKIIASGGVSSLQDLNELRRVNVEGVIVGKAIYEGRISLEEIKNFNQ